MDGFLARRRSDPRYASERAPVHVPSTSIQIAYYQASAKAESSGDGPDKTIKKKKKGIYKKGEDADGDGVTNEAEKKKPKKEDWKKDADGDGVPAAIDKDEKKKKDKKDKD